MGPHQSRMIEQQFAKADKAGLQLADPQIQVKDPNLFNLSKSSGDAGQVATKVDRIQAKIWNPNNPDSWEPNMRGYHSVTDSEYMLPSDEIEQNRLETQHYLLRIRFQGDIVCPDAKELVKQDGVKVLDVGCAKGFWLESVRMANPFGEYHGVDIAENLASEPEKSGQNNITIKFGNVLERLPYEDNAFDYVHQRLLVLGMPKERFPDALRELIRVTKPGGWIELVESDMMLYDSGPYSKIFRAAFLDALQARGLDCYAATNLEYYASQVAANVSNQGVTTVILPTHEDTPLGRLSERNGKIGLLGLEDWLHKSMNITREEYRELIENCFTEFLEYNSYGLARALYFQVVK